MIPIAGLLSPIEDPLTDVLEWLHTSIGLTWGWSIVALTVMIRLILVPLTLKQIRSMQRLQQYAPELKALQAKYKGDKQKLNEEVMKFYREKKVNPAASCLPIVVQIPIFISLFFVLRGFTTEIQPRFPESDLSFIRIVPDITENISTHWSGILLLSIYVVSQVASTFFMATTMDKRQRYLFMGLPFVFIPFIIRFPVGLMLYWVTTNLWTTGQGVVTRRLAPKRPPLPDKRSSRTPPSEDAVRDGRRPADSRSRKRRPKEVATATAGGAAVAVAGAEDDGKPAETAGSDENGDGEAPERATTAAADAKRQAKNEPTKKSKSGQKPAPKAGKSGQVRRRKKRGPKGGPRTRR